MQKDRTMKWSRDSEGRFIEEKTPSIIPKTRKCNRCGRRLNLLKFSKHKRGKYGRRGICKECDSIYSQEYHNRPEVKKRSAEWAKDYWKRMYTPKTKLNERLKNTYDITLAEYEKIVEKQNGVCAICQKANNVKGQRLGVDHDHKTGKIRGLLCNHCNKGISGFRDNPTLLSRAVTYLRKELR